jgi:hypothetical protein
MVEVEIRPFVVIRYCGGSSGLQKNCMEIRPFDVILYCGGGSGVQKLCINLAI